MVLSSIVIVTLSCIHTLTIFCGCSAPNKNGQKKRPCGCCGQNSGNKNNDGDKNFNNKINNNDVVKNIKKEVDKDSIVGMNPELGFKQRYEHEVDKRKDNNVREIFENGYKKGILKYNKIQNCTKNDSDNCITNTSGTNYPDYDTTYNTETDNNLYNNKGLTYNKHISNDGLNTGKFDYLISNRNNTYGNDQYKKGLTCANSSSNRWNILSYFSCLSDKVSICKIKNFVFLIFSKGKNVLCSCFNEKCKIKRYKKLELITDEDYNAQYDNNGFIEKSEGSDEYDKFSDSPITEINDDIFEPKKTISENNLYSLLPNVHSVTATIFSGRNKKRIWIFTVGCSVGCLMSYFNPVIGASIIGVDAILIGYDFFKAHK